MKSLHRFRASLSVVSAFFLVTLFTPPCGAAPAAELKSRATVPAAFAIYDPLVPGRILCGGTFEFCCQWAESHLGTHVVAQKFLNAVKSGPPPSPPGMAVALSVGVSPVPGMMAVPVRSVASFGRDTMALAEFSRTNGNVNLSPDQKRQMEHWRRQTVDARKTRSPKDADGDH